MGVTGRAISPQEPRHAVCQKRQLGSIGHDAHIGGAVGGYAIMLLLRPELLVTDLWLVLLMALPIGLLYLLEKKGFI